MDTFAMKMEEHERQLSALRLQHGSPSSRRSIRHGLRRESLLTRHSPTVAGRDSTPSQGVSSITTEIQATRPSGHIPGLLRLPLELREQIYGYLLPYNDQHLFQIRGLDCYIPNFAVRSPRDPDQHNLDQLSLYYSRDYERVEICTAFMRLNKQLHCGTRYVFFDSIPHQGEDFCLPCPFGIYETMRTVLILKSAIVHTEIQSGTKHSFRVSISLNRRNS